MAAACLWCQIAHKEWFCCLLGEMVTNWCCRLSAIKERSTYWNEAHFPESRQHCFVAQTHQNNMPFRKWATWRRFQARLSNGVNRWFHTVVDITLTQSLKLNKSCFPLECLDVLFYLLYLLLFVWPKAIIHPHIMLEALNLSLQIKSWDMIIRGLFGSYPNSNLHEPLQDFKVENPHHSSTISTKLSHRAF